MVILASPNECHLLYASRSIFVVTCVPIKLFSLTAHFIQSITVQCYDHGHPFVTKQSSFNEVFHTSYNIVSMKDMPFTRTSPTLVATGNDAHGADVKWCDTGNHSYSPVW